MHPRIWGGLDPFLSFIVFHHPRRNLLLIFLNPFIILGRMLWILLVFDVSSYVIIPWFSINFIFNLGTVGQGFIQSLSDQLDLITWIYSKHRRQCSQSICHLIFSQGKWWSWFPWITWSSQLYACDRGSNKSLWFLIFLIIDRSPKSNLQRLLAL